MRVLVVDDEPAARALSRAVISAAGHSVASADDGEQALRMLAGEDFDAIVTDADMPGINGFELAGRVRADAGRYVYVIMLTALSDDAERLAGMHAGVDDYVTKPVRPTRLTALLVAAERVVALHRQLEEQRRLLEDLATHDGLTGVFNRRRLDSDLSLAFSRFGRYARPFCLALFDVDRFKAYNDHYGHLAGDDALRAVGRTLAEGVRDVDSVYRYGGEEFLCLLPEQDLEGGLVAVQRLVQAVAALHLPHGGSEHDVVSVSAGLAVSDLALQAGPEHLVAAADAALYLAKASGRNRVVSSGGAHEVVDGQLVQAAEAVPLGSYSIGVEVLER